MVQLARNSALVGGAIPASMSNEITVLAIRGFLRDGQAVPIGATVTLPAAVALELIGMAKAVRVVPVQSEDTESAPKRRGRPPKQSEEPQA